LSIFPANIDEIIGEIFHLQPTDKNIPFYGLNAKFFPSNGEIIDEI
jgi:hypothetical protein